MQKYAMLTMQIGKEEDNVAILLPDNETMTDFGEGEYKYLGVLKACDIIMENMKKNSYEGIQKKTKASTKI